MLTKRKTNLLTASVLTLFLRQTRKITGDHTVSSRTTFSFSHQSISIRPHQEAVSSYIWMTRTRRNQRNTDGSVAFRSDSYFRLPQSVRDLLSPLRYHSSSACCSWFRHWRKLYIKKNKNLSFFFIFNFMSSKGKYVRIVLKNVHKNG